MRHMALRNTKCCPKLAVCCLLCCFSSALLGQVDTPPEPAAPPAQADNTHADVAASSLEVATQLLAVTARYRMGAVADRVRVTLVSDDGHSDMNSLIIRTVPGKSGLCRLEFGPMTLVAQRGVLRGVHSRDRWTFVEVPASDPSAGPGKVVAELLPMLVLPQISLAFDEDAVDWCPLVDDLVWDSGRRVNVDGASGVELRGHWTHGNATLVIAEGRVRKVAVDLDEAGSKRVIVDCSPVEPGDPEAWPLDITGRRKLNDLALLGPLDDPLEVGEHWPTTLSVIDATTGMPIELVETNASDRLAKHLRPVIIFSDDASDLNASLDEVAQGLLSLRRGLLQGRLDGRIDKRLRLGPVIGVVQTAQDGQTLDRLASLKQVWTGMFGEKTSPLASGATLSWMARESRVLDRLIPGAQCVLVLLDERGTILAKFAIHPAAGLDDAVLSEYLLSVLHNR